jgi:hypothetical protein
MITPLIDPEIVEGVKHVAASGHSLLVILPVPNVPEKFSRDSEEIAYRIMMVERSNIIIALEKTASVVHWPETLPLSASLSKLKGIGIVS